MLSKKQLSWQKWYKKNKTKRAAYWKKYYKKTKEILKSRAKEYHIKNRNKILIRMRSKDPKHRRTQHLWNRFKVDLYIVEQALKISNYRCDLCRRRFSQVGPQLDHCHRTGKVRGLLCVKCNTGLGKVGDTVESLERAIKYLKGDL